MGTKSKFLPKNTKKVKEKNTAAILDFPLFLKNRTVGLQQTFLLQTSVSPLSENVSFIGAYRADFPKNILKGDF